MKVYDEKHIKNVVLLGAVKSGKTTLAETMLFEAGIINRRGTVEDKNTVSDFHDVEHERENSVYATSLHTEWRNYKINIIDTPGLDDFIGEIASSIRVADTAVLLLNAHQGVEVGTELIWNYVDKFKKPTIFAVNQVDHPKSDFDAVIESAKERFGAPVTIMQYPVNQGDEFNCIIDLLKMKMYKFGPDGGKPEKLPIPDDQKEKAEQLHNELVEKAAENDETLMELYFEKGTLSEDEMRKGLKIGMMEHSVFPVFCFSAKLNMGSGRMMGFIDNVAPAAMEMPPELTEEGAEVQCDPNQPVSLFVFKTLVEPYLGKLTFFKVNSGFLKTGQDLINAQTGGHERINQIFIMDGKNRNTVESLAAGDIGATVKLKDTKTNHTLHAAEFPVAYQKIEFPEPRVRVSIEAEENDLKKLAEISKELGAEDPTLSIQFNKELKQLILSAQGDLHLDVTKWRLKNIYDVGVNFGNPKIPYRETIQKRATAGYRHKKQSGGSGQFGEITITIMPYIDGMANPEGFTIRKKEEILLSWGGKLVFYNCIVGGAIDARFVPSVQKGILESMEEGPITKSYVRDVAVLLHDGKMHPVDSNDISFKIAGAQAFKIAFMKADPKLLEPINSLSIVVPEDLMGEVMTDLQTRRATILGMDTEGKNQKINAKIPLAEMNGYNTALKSITQGKAAFTTAFEEYTQVPYDLQEKLIKLNSTEVE
ncbi:MAG: elongation factor G [Bacteroidetes bacterium]|nr:elongation factor G [Bacteroidota bacterium]MDA1119152.1 elongation factor G [Bacteroidota bacterium]